MNKNNTAIRHCPVCCHSESRSILERDDFPLFQLIPKEEYITDDHFAPLGIVGCNNCGHMYNRMYSEELAQRQYRNEVLSNMPVTKKMFQHLEEIALLIDDIHWKGKDVLEIGGGVGSFSEILAKQAKSVVMIEPSRGIDIKALERCNVGVINEFFSSDLIDYQTDFVVCRGVLEYIADPLSFLENIYSVMKDNAYIYLMVPRADLIKDQAILYDFQLNCVQYFMESTLDILVNKAGFQIEKRLVTMIDHDYGVLLKKSDLKNGQVFDVTTSSVCSNRCWSLQHQHLCNRLNDRLQQGREFLSSLNGPLVIYGSNWHASAFLSLFGNEIEVKRALDDNPSYHDKQLYLRGCRVDVVAPESGLLGDSGAIVIGAYLHQAAIQEKLGFLGYDGKIISTVPLLHEITR